MSNLFSQSGHQSDIKSARVFGFIDCENVFLTKRKSQVHVHGIEGNES